MKRFEEISKNLESRGFKVSCFLSAANSAEIYVSSVNGIAESGERIK